MKRRDALRSMACTAGVGALGWPAAATARTLNGLDRKSTRLNSSH